MQKMRERAKEIFMAGVAAADPFQAVQTALDANPVQIGPGRLVIIAIGKAAGRMATAALQTYPNADRVVVVTNYENAQPIDGAEVFAAGHPEPDENGYKAAQAIISVLGGMNEGDQVLALISGGGSALLPAPRAALSLADKTKVNSLLLKASVDIVGTNLVRQQLSDLKGGGFLRHAAPAKVRGLILSDVIGDDIRAIASGPTASPIGTAAEAVVLLKSLDLWAACPDSAKSCLLNPSPVTDIPPVENTLIGSNPLSVAAMQKACPTAVVGSNHLIGNVSDAAEQIVTLSKPGQITLFGGETTVQVTGSGRGGRNQELALRVALLVERENWSDGWVYLQGGTDGRDGPTDAAGGLVDGGTLRRMRDAGIDPLERLADNDSHPALQAAGDLLSIGATGTNVADLGVLIRA
jgi:hydroxypyruvate reductase